MTEEDLNFNFDFRRYFNHIDLRVESYGGLCPVQMEGKIGRHFFYLRARGEIMSFEVFDEHKPGHSLFYHDAHTHPNTQYGAGYATVSEVKDFMDEAVREYRLTKKSS
jgi:hypothetical protein